MKKKSKKKKTRGAKKGTYLRSCPKRVTTKRLKDGPWIQKEGKLGGPGYTDRSRNERHHILGCALKNYGYRSTMGSLQALTRGKMSKTHMKTIKADIEWLKTMPH